LFGSAIDKEESKLAVIDPFTNEKIQDAKEDDDDYVVVDFVEFVISQKLAPINLLMSL
jgi:hypothetical protein